MLADEKQNNFCLHPSVRWDPKYFSLSCKAQMLGRSIPAITIVTCEYDNRALFLEHFSYQRCPPAFSRVNDLGASSVLALRFREERVFFFDGNLR